MIKQTFKPYNLKDVERNSSKALFSVVSTFAGGGGSSTGYKNAGGKILLANEFEPEAINTYKSNHPTTPVAAMNLRKITNRKRSRILKFFEGYGVKRGELDIFDGSPPCTTFSMASGGKSKHKIDKKNISHEGMTNSRIGMLILDYMKCVSILQPKVFVVENVVPVVKEDVFSHAVKGIRNNGYTVGYKKILSSELGVAQGRARLIAIGVRNDIATKLKIQSMPNKKNNIFVDLCTQDGINIFPDFQGESLVLKDVIQDLDIDEEERQTLLNNCIRNSSYELLQHMYKDPDKNLKISDIFPEWQDNKWGDFSLVRSSWNKPSPTLTCRGQIFGPSGVHHPTEDRKFTIAEMKRITSLPDDYKLTGTFNDKARRIGNMVPSNMIKFIAESLYQKVLMPFENISTNPLKYSE